MMRKHVESSRPRSTVIGCDIPYDPEDDLNEKYEFARSSCCIWRFMTDKRYQDRVCGREAMKLILDFIKTGPCRKAESARTSSAPENTAARRLYASLGFEEVPEAYDSEDDLIPAALKL